MENLITNYIDLIYQIKAFNNNGDSIKLFTGSFYEIPGIEDVFIVTATHCIMDDNISKLELSFFNNCKLKTHTLNLNEYECEHIQDYDLTVIYIKKPIFYDVHYKITSNTIHKPLKYNYYNLLSYFVKTLGYYDANIEPCILENAQIVSPYSPDKFYIKSSNIPKGYSGAPVFIEFYSQTNILQIFLIGYISKNVGNNNIEVISAENLLLVDKFLKRKYLS